MIDLLGGSSDPFARIAAISADAVICVDETQTIVFFNRGAELIFGYDAEEILGQPLERLLPSAFRAAHHEHVDAFGHSPTMAKRMGERLPISGRRKNGEEFPAEASITKLEVEGRRLYSAVLRDITSRQRLQETQQFLARVGTALVETPLDYRRLLAAVAELAVPALGDWAVLLTWDEERGLDRFAVIAADPEQAADADAVRADADPVPADHPARAAVEERTSVLIAEVDDDVLERLAPDPALRERFRALGAASAMFVPLVGRTRVLGVLAHFAARAGRFGEQELALAEELARRAALAIENASLYAEAQEAIAAREELMRIVSHDVGNPLSAIFVGTKVLTRGLEGGQEADALTPHVQGIRSSAGQIQRIIDDLLDAERIQAGRLRLDLETVTAGRLVEEAVERMRALAVEQDVALVAEGTDVAARVTADPARLDQVFSNLIGNALKFTPTGGRVVVRVRVESPDVVFEVEDNGRGIAPADLPHIFERFWQGKKALGRGAGLGLPIARGLAEAHGGTIGARSEQGVGSVFWLRLPLDPLDPDDGSSPPAAGA